MKTFTVGIPHQGDVKITKLARSYRVQYGLQIKSNLTYESASKELGECIMHALGCNGFHDDNMEASERKRIADRVDGFDRDDLGESPDY